MIYLFLTIYLTLFAYLSYRKIEHGIFLFFLLLPTYLIRFHIGFLPTTMLEMMIWILLIIWITKYHQSLILNLKSSILKHKLLFISIAIFLLASTLSIFTSSNLRGALGEWKAFYVEPVLVFFMIISVGFNMRCNTPLTPLKGGDPLCEVSITSPLEGGRGVFHRGQGGVSPKQGSSLFNTIICALLISGLITSLFTIYQHFTGFMVPYAFWENRNTYRVTAWYGFPNGVGLFLAPLVPLALYEAKQKWQNFKHISHNTYHISNYTHLVKFLWYVVCGMWYVLAIIFAKSTGALIGIASGIGFLLLLNKKTRWLTVVIGLVSIVSVVSLVSLKPIKDELTFQDRSGQIRLSIYKETINLLKDHPIAGTGLASYSEKIEPYHTLVNGERIEIFHHPHNIFLTMWVNLGLLGLVGFMLIVISFFKIGIVHSTYHQSNTAIQQYSNIAIFLISSMITLITTGLVDSPYIKNDLSILFWTIIALLVIQTSTKNSTKSTLETHSKL